MSEPVPLANIPRPKTPPDYSQERFEMIIQALERDLARKFDRRSDLALEPGKRLVLASASVNTQFAIGINAAGHLALINYLTGESAEFVVDWEDVDGLTEQLASITSAYEADDATLQASIDIVASTAADNSGAIATLSTNLSSETSAREAGDSARVLTSTYEAQVTALTNADSAATIDREAIRSEYRVSAAVPSPLRADASGSMQFEANKNADGTANDGEIRVLAGYIDHPTAGRITFGSNAFVNTLWEGGGVPEDGVFYLICSDAEDLDTRFPTVTKGSNRFFTATYEATTGTWRAYGLDSGVTFTPDDGDVCVAIGTKTASDSGLATLRRIMSDTTQVAAAITSEASTRASADSAAGVRLDTLEATIDTPSTGLSAVVSSHTSAIADLDSTKAEVSDVTALEATVDRNKDTLDATSWDDVAYIWNWEVGTVDGWTVVNGTASYPSGGGIQVTRTAGSFNIQSPPITASGARFKKIIIDAECVTLGTGSDTSGYLRLFWQTGGHGFSGSYYDLPRDSTAFEEGERRLLVYDMDDPTAGSTDWTSNTITRVRFDGSAKTGAVWIIHSVKIVGVGTQRTSATVKTLADALVDGSTGQAIASWLVEAAAGGGAPTQIGIRNGSDGSSDIALVAKQVFFGDDTVFEDTYNTMYTEDGGGERVRLLGPFPGSGDLLLWAGPDSVSLNSETWDNGYITISHSNGLFVDLPVTNIPFTQYDTFTAWSNASTSWTTVGSIDVDNVPADGFIEFSGSEFLFDPTLFVTPNGTYYGEWKITEQLQSGGTEYTLFSGDFSITYSGPASGTHTRTNWETINQPQPQNLSGDVRYMLKVRRASGSNTGGLGAAPAQPFYVKRTPAG